MDRPPCQKEGFVHIDARFEGCVEVVDDTFVCISAPYEKDDGNKAAYFCRKNFYALSVMVVRTNFILFNLAHAVSRMQMRNVKDSFSPLSSILTTFAVAPTAVIEKNAVVAVNGVSVTI